MNLPIELYQKILCYVNYDILPKILLINKYFYDIIIRDCRFAKYAEYIDYYNKDCSDVIKSLKYTTVLTIKSILQTNALISAICVGDYHLYMYITTKYNCDSKQIFENFHAAGLFEKKITSEIYKKIDLSLKVHVINIVPMRVIFGIISKATKYDDIELIDTLPQELLINAVSSIKLVAIEKKCLEKLIKSSIITMEMYMHDIAKSRRWPNDGVNWFEKIYAIDNLILDQHSTIIIDWCLHHANVHELLWLSIKNVSLAQAISSNNHHLVAHHIEHNIQYHQVSYPEHIKQIYLIGDI
jgi:hypothetical protein